jgi:hypothetical protein
MNARSRSAKRLPRNITASKSNAGCGGQRAWAREVNCLADEDLILCVRAQVAVDDAVNTYRRNAAPPISFEVPA